MSATVKPLPCPVCGLAPGYSRNAGSLYQYHCIRYDTEVVRHGIYTGARRLKEDALADWNAIVNATRAATIQEKGATK